MDMKKKVIVLGGTSSIGKAIARRFAREGWQVLIVAQNFEECIEVTDSLEGANHIGCNVDVCKEGDMIKLKNLVENKFKDFDSLVNTLDLSQKHAALQSDFVAWDNLLQVMLYGTVRSCRILIPFIKDGGRIIHITSILYERVSNGSSAYGVAKAAITQFSRSLAVELAPRNILSNIIAPGFVSTTMSETHSEWETDRVKNKYINDNLPLKRMGNPEEIAGVTWFLAGPDASYMTGSVCTVDGGMTVTF